MSEQVQDFWEITRLFTKGINKVQGSCGGHFVTITGRGGLRYYLTLGETIFSTYEEAKEAAEKKRTNKIASLEKQLIKLKNIEF